MANVTCLKHLTAEYEFLLFGSFQGVSKFLGLLLLFGFGLKILCSDWFSSGLIRCLCDLIEILKLRLSPKSGKGGALIDEMEAWKEKSNSYTDSDEIVNSDPDPDSDFDSDDEYELFDSVNPGEKLYRRFDVQSDAPKDDQTYENEYKQDDYFDENFGTYDDAFTLRRLLKIEKHRVNAARAEVAKERAAAATAAEEAMAMILRLQHEKSVVEMEFIQYKRVAEEKQIHDQEVIQSLQWLAWRHECENTLLEDQLRLCRHNLSNFLTRDDRRNECEKEARGDDDQRAFNGNLWEAFENVFYSSLDADNYLMTP